MLMQSAGGFDKGNIERIHVRGPSGDPSLIGPLNILQILGRGNVAHLKPPELVEPDATIPKPLRFRTWGSWGFGKTELLSVHANLLRSRAEQSYLSRRGAGVIASSTPGGSEGAIDEFLSSKGLAIDPFRWVPEQMSKGQGEQAASSSLGSYTNTIPETITPAAEKHAKSLGMYGSIILTKKIVRETIPSMKALYIDLKLDPDEGGIPTICFAITFRESVDRAVELDDALQDTLFDQIPTDHRVHLSFAYHLE